MNREDIIRMAREAGIPALSDIHLTLEELERFAALVAAAKDAEHKMAEESREIGLTMDGWNKIGCVNHDCDECQALEQQTRPATREEKIVRPGVYEVPVEQQPAAWVGLTDEELFEIWVQSPAETENRFAFARMVMVALKEKNT